MTDIKSSLTRNRHAKRAWDYRTKTDTIGHILYPNYFAEVADVLCAGELIFVTAADGFEPLVVKSASPPVVVRVRDMDAPHNMFPAA